MKVPRMRFSVSRMMIGVAVVGVVLGADQLRRRREYCLDRARYHRCFTGFWCGNHIGVPYAITRRGQPPVVPDWEALRRFREADSHVDWHWAVAEEFEHAARRPWLATPAEPPCPGWDHFYALNVWMGLIQNP